MLTPQFVMRAIVEGTRDYCDQKQLKAMHQRVDRTALSYRSLSDSGLLTKTISAMSQIGLTKSLLPGAATFDCMDGGQTLPHYPQAAKTRKPVANLDRDSLHKHP